jgi:hypothetical protein
MDWQEEICEDWMNKPGNFSRIVFRNPSFAWCMSFASQPLWPPAVNPVQNRIKLYS